MVTRVMGEFVVASVLVWLGYRSWTRAEDIRQQALKHSQGVRQPWRSLLYPQWYWRGDYFIVSMRGAGIGAFMIAIVLLILAAITLLTGHVP